MYHCRAPVTRWNPMALRPNFWTASTAKYGTGQWKTATPLRCRLGASVTTTLYPAKPRVYIPSLTFVSYKMPRSMLAWDIPRSADSNPLLRLLRMLSVPNLIGTVPLVGGPVC